MRSFGVDYNLWLPTTKHTAIARLLTRQCGVVGGGGQLIMLTQRETCWWSQNSAWDPENTISTDGSFSDSTETLHHTHCFPQQHTADNAERYPLYNILLSRASTVWYWLSDVSRLHLMFIPIGFGKPSDWLGASWHETISCVCGMTDKHTKARVDRRHMPKTKERKRALYL
jgi:hypothetical protein